MYQYLQKLSVGKIPNGFAKVKELVSQSGLTLRPKDCDPKACQVLLSMEFSRQGYRSG